MNSKIRNIVLALALACSTMAGAQVEASGAQTVSGIRHIKSHTLMEQVDSAFNVVDIDLDWPDSLGSDSVTFVQKFIITSLLKQSIVDIDRALEVFNNSCGQPVTGQLAYLPDDDRFCYVTVRAKVRSYEPGRWICYELEARNEPQPRSRIKASSLFWILTFDLQAQKVLLPEDLLNGRAIAWGDATQEFYDTLLKPLTDAQYYSMQSTDISGLWLERRGVGLRMRSVTDEGLVTYDSLLPWNLITPLLTKEAKKLTRGIRTNQ